MGKPIVFFDGYCNLCSSSVQWIIKNDLNNTFQFAPLNGETAKKIIEDEDILKEDSIILFLNNKFYLRSTAVLKIAAKLKYPSRFLSVFLIVPVFIRNWVYQIVARNRYKWFGKKEVCWIPSEELNIKFLK
ncbi:MAG: DCC1-like thiol-disulfide oxidoreductase family protein [Bacteroidia bacterium]